MREIEIKKGKISVDLMLKYGFTDTCEGFSYTTHILGGEMQLVFYVNKNGQLFSELSDNFGEEYTLHLNEGASGKFVGLVKSEYEDRKNEVLSSILEYSVFKSHQALSIIEYIKERYGNTVEFLWDDDNGIARRDDNKKWYIVFMTVPKSKLGFKDNSRIEVINLRLRSDEVSNLIDNKHFFPAYHMNKKHWITVLLDSGIETQKIFALIDESYLLVGNKKELR